jgi:hypothetical protein
MSSRPADRIHANQVELGIEAQVLSRKEERLLCRACADLKEACALHRELDCVVRDLTGSLDANPVAPARASDRATLGVEPAKSGARLPSDDSSATAAGSSAKGTGASSGVRSPLARAGDMAVSA